MQYFLKSSNGVMHYCKNLENNAHYFLEKPHKNVFELWNFLVFHKSLRLCNIKKGYFLLIPTKKNCIFFFLVGLYEVNLIEFLQKYISPVME